MAVPTHRPDCETMIWGTRCPDCGDWVYFFSCSCGSKVYFDLNRPPWNPHQDRCIHYLVRVLFDIHGYTPAQILAIVDERARTSGIPIPTDIERWLVSMSQRAQPGLIIHHVLPNEEGCVAVGRVIEINHQVNFFKRLKLEENPISKGLLGILAEGPYVEITVRDDPEPGSRDCHQFNFFCALDIFRRSGVRHHSKVWVSLTPHDPPKGDPIWLTDDIQEIL